MALETADWCSRIRHWFLSFLQPTPKDLFQILDRTDLYPIEINCDEYKVVSPIPSCSRPTLVPPLLPPRYFYCSTSHTSGFLAKLRFIFVFFFFVFFPLRNLRSTSHAIFKPPIFWHVRPCVSGWAFLPLPILLVFYHSAAQLENMRREEGEKTKIEEFVGTR